MTDARTLAKATAAATRAAPLVSAMARLTEGLGLTIERQANAVLEELDLLRHFLREALLDRVIAGQAAPPPLDVPAHVAAMLDGSAPPPEPAPYCPLLRPAQSTPPPDKKRSGAIRRARTGDRNGDRSRTPNPKPL
jgi:hypothetical protein